MAMKTIVFAYSEFGCAGIEALLEAGYAIESVFTHRDDPDEMVFFRSVARLCVEHGLSAYTLDDDRDPAMFRLMQDIAPEYIFSFYYRSLIPDTILALARKGTFNLHGALLPQYRGCAVINWVLVNGEKTTGVTLHHMISRADAGDIVGQKAVDIAYDDTAFTLRRKLVEAASVLLKEQLPLIAKGKATHTPQDLSKGKYYGRRRPADGLIDWTRPAETVRNLVRAVAQPYPGAFTFAQDRKLFIWDSAVDAKASGAPGTVLSLAPLTIACGEGALVVKAGQAEGGLYLSGEQLGQALQLAAGMCMRSHTLAA